MKPHEMAEVVQRMLKIEEDADYNTPTSDAIKAAHELSRVFEEDYRATPRSVVHLSPEDLAYLIDTASEYIKAFG